LLKKGWTSLQVSGKKAATSSSLFHIDSRYSGGVQALAIQELIAIRYRSIRHSKLRFCYAALLPITALFFILRILPITESLYMSFCDWRLIGGFRSFSGFGNYVELFKDEQFSLAMKNTLLYAGTSVIVGIGLALPISLAMVKQTRYSRLLEAVYFLPFITPMVPMSVAWKWIYDAQYGLLNYCLSFFGIDPVGWLIYPETAIWALIAMNVWKNLGYNIVLFLVGLRGIPAVYYEASSIDGADGWNRLKHITFPLLKPMLLYVFVTSTITAFNVFTQVYVMTLGSQAAPSRAVRVLLYDIYENAFRYFRLGYACAESVILTVIILILTGIQFRLIKSEL
jgi:multiple sugar transport system permease protein